MQKTKQTTGHFLADHSQVIYDTFYKNGESPKSTWEELQTTLPKISEYCGYDTFRKSLGVLIAMQEKISKLGHKGNAKNLEGWTIRQNAKGYYSLHKSVQGFTESIYLGKDFDETKALEKIADKMTKIREKQGVK
jgi:hypothetical protein